MFKETCVNKYCRFISILEEEIIFELEYRLKRALCDKASKVNVANYKYLMESKQTFSLSFSFRRCKADTFIECGLNINPNTRALANVFL